MFSFVPNCIAKKSWPNFSKLLKWPMRVLLLACVLMACGHFGFSQLDLSKLVQVLLSAANTADICE